ncbi:MAG: SPOR domain-containing protein [Pseudomonadota bacterium]
MPAYYDDEEFGGAARASGRRVGSKLSAVLGVAVLLGAMGAGGFYAWSLVERDPDSVPVIQAAIGPVRTVPADGGAAPTRHAERASYAVLDASAPAAGPLVLTAVSAGPQPGDFPARQAPSLGGASGQSLGGASAAAPVGLGIPAPGVPAVAAPGAGASLGSRPARPSTADDASRQVAALGDADRSLYPLPEALSAPRVHTLIVSEIELLQSRRPVRVISEQRGPVPPRGEGSAVAPPVSPIVRRRPAGLVERFAAADADLIAAAAIAERRRAAERSPIQLQLGAFGDRTVIEAEWSRLQEENSDVLGNRALAVQQTVSGGKTYYRLRIGPFDSSREAQAVCQALKTRGYACLLAVNTETRG